MKVIGQGAGNNDRMWSEQLVGNPWPITPSVSLSVTLHAAYTLNITDDAWWVPISADLLKCNIMVSIRNPNAITEVIIFRDGQMTGKQCTESQSAQFVPLALQKELHISHITLQINLKIFL